LRELGDDPATGKPMVIKDGRWGPYVTDGETNASLRKGDEVESITPQRAAELLADRRAASPTPARSRARSSSAGSTSKARTASGKARGATGTAGKSRTRPRQGA
jgi:DNA topoisomerase I